MSPLAKGLTADRIGGVQRFSRIAFWRPSRRHLLRTAALGLGAGLVAALGSLTGRTLALQPRARRIVVPSDNGQDVLFLEGAIICRTGDLVRAYSSRCTHLGCQITRQIEGLLVCPCHGSRFHPDGTVAAGPASRPLEALPLERDGRTGALVILIP
jgi:nitrite reductase/ring-hydroxylating ferredoxin subunit